MKAVVFHDVGDIRLEDVPEPKIQQPDDAIVRITSSAICGTDLHFIRGTVPGMKKGRILGHEGVGVVSEGGKNCRSLRPGDRVIIPSTLGCGSCNYCRGGYYSQCNKINPGGTLAGTVVFGGPEENGGLDGLQAEYARVPFAASNLLKLPGEITDDQAILMSDILPTSYQAAEMAEIRPSVSVAIFGAGPVGMLAIACAKHLGAGRLFVIDQVESRLEMARGHGAETINFAKEDPVEVLRELTDGSGPDRVIDAVGVDATSAGASEQEHRKEFAKQMTQGDPKLKKAEGKWWIGGAPSQALQWAVASVAKAGTVSVIGVYPPSLTTFPIGEFMNKNLRMNAGNCHHRRYLPMLIELVRSGVFRTEQFLTHKESILSAIEAYHTFDKHEHGWLKVKLDPHAH
ncbi:MAG: zinc-dependent alcohol dehydrogenase [Acidobacteriaceae bacterium]